jgi:hypothetical protein
MQEGRPTFRRAEEKDLESIADLLSQREQRPDLLEWLRWKYLRCPDGPGRILVAEDAEGLIVGMMAYLPRRFRSEAAGTFCLMQGVAAFVPKALREKGIYSGITALARQEMNVPKIAFPNKLSIGFGVKFGWRVLAPMRVWRFPVSFGLLLSKTRFKLLAPAADAFSRIYALCWTGRVPRDLTMEAVERFGRDYAGEGDRIQGVRSADYLNWRFIDNPARAYCAYEFLEGTDRIGYCVYAKSGLSAELFDFFLTRRRRSCLRLLLEHCRREEIARLSFRGVHLGVAKLGFIPGGIHGNCIVFKAPQGKWMITLCDSDW